MKKKLQDLNLGPLSYGPSKHANEPSFMPNLVGSFCFSYRISEDGSSTGQMPVSWNHNTERHLHQKLKIIPIYYKTL